MTVSAASGQIKGITLGEHENTSILILKKALHILCYRNQRLHIRLGRYHDVSYTAYAVTTLIVQIITSLFHLKTIK